MKPDRESSSRNISFLSKLIWKMIVGSNVQECLSIIHILPRHQYEHFHLEERWVADGLYSLWSDHIQPSVLGAPLETVVKDIYTRVWDARDDESAAVNDGRSISPLYVNKRIYLAVYRQLYLLLREGERRRKGNETTGMVSEQLKKIPRMKRAGWMKNDIKLTLIRNDGVLKVCSLMTTTSFFHFHFTGL